MNTDEPARVVCVGELLWDSLPDGLFLGGAPFNVAAHLAARGVRSAIATRVGDDRLGEEAVLRAVGFGVDTSLVQRDPSLPTGLVRVQVGPDADVRYEILAPAAWDAFSADESVIRGCSGAEALVFGTLAQRDERARAAIRDLCELPLLRVLDVNLRPPHDDVETVEQSLWLADVVKCNEEELRRIDGRSGAGEDELREAARRLAERFGCVAICVTRGAEGAALLHEGTWTVHPGYSITLADPVGAGDAFLAGLLQAMLEGRSADEMLAEANLLGAFVASRRGAIPTCDRSELARLASGRAAGGPPGAEVNPGGSAAPTGR